jgi:hypothetical protein
MFDVLLVLLDDQVLDDLDDDLDDQVRDTLPTPGRGASNWKIEPRTLGGCFERRCSFRRQPGADPRAKG